MITMGSCGGSPKWNSQNFFRQCFQKNSNCGQYMADDHKLLYLWNKLQIICWVFITKITRSVICVFSLQRLQISRDFDIFSNFLEKPETFLRTIVWYYVQHNKVHSFQEESGQINFSLEPPLPPKKAFWWDRFNGAIENFLKVDRVPKMGYFTKICLNTPN